MQTSHPRPHQPFAGIFLDLSAGLKREPTLALGSLFTELSQTLPRLRAKLCRPTLPPSQAPGEWTLNLSARTSACDACDVTRVRGLKSRSPWRAKASC